MRRTQLRSGHRLTASRAPQICQRIATAMGGTLTATSEGRDRGTTFTFAIPLLEQDAGAPGSLTAAQRTPSLKRDTASCGHSASAPEPDAQAASAAATVRVLVAEDDALCTAVMRKVLERLHVAGTIVGDGEAAVEAYKNGACRRAMRP